MCDVVYDGVSRRRSGLARLFGAARCSYLWLVVGSRCVQHNILQAKARCSRPPDTEPLRGQARGPAFHREGTVRRGRFRRREDRRRAFLSAEGGPQGARATGKPRNNRFVDPDSVVSFFTSPRFSGDRSTGRREAEAGRVRGCSLRRDAPHPTSSLRSDATLSSLKRGEGTAPAAFHRTACPALMPFVGALFSGTWACRHFAGGTPVLCAELPPMCSIPRPDGRRRG